jgi:hypothetical protein
MRFPWVGSGSRPPSFLSKTCAAVATFCAVSSDALVTTLSVTRLMLNAPGSEQATAHSILAVQFLQCVHGLP